MEEAIYILKCNNDKLYCFRNRDDVEQAKRYFEYVDDDDCVIKKVYVEEGSFYIPDKLYVCVSITSDDRFKEFSDCDINIETIDDSMNGIIDYDMYEGRGIEKEGNTTRVYFEINTAGWETRSELEAVCEKMAEEIYNANMNL